MTITLNGPTGLLEGLWEPSAGAKRCALLCHPHPQYGGSMHDGVLSVAATTLDDAPAGAVAHLRFNFRGVGASAGHYDNGLGEQDDVVAAWDWLAEQGPWDEMLLIGYSFGAATAWAARERCTQLDRLLLIAPPTAAMPFSGSAGATATHVVVGDGDSYCNTDALPIGATATVIAGGDHFFSGVTAELAAALSAGIRRTGEGTAGSE